MPKKSLKLSNLFGELPITEVGGDKIEESLFYTIFYSDPVFDGPGLGRS